MKAFADISGGRLTAAEYDKNFADIKPPLTTLQAQVESARCLFCYDAPCITACPTSIDIPGFIRGINTGNIDGAANTILASNILGASCARICPVEILCEQACVRNQEQECRPVLIGQLQRYALDHRRDKSAQPVSRAPSTGKQIAIIGSGPAGLSAAWHLASKGHDTIIFEAADKPGGLNAYGIARYKLSQDTVDEEIRYLMGIGGIELRCGTAIGRDIPLSELRREYDAVFIAAGLQAVNHLKIDGEDREAVRSAVDYIAELRQCDDLAKLPVGRRVVVIGAGNTAVDIATQSRQLGAEEVTMVYRRGPEHMSATDHEQHVAKDHGVTLRHHARPTRVLHTNDAVTGVEFERTYTDEQGNLSGTGEYFTLPADMVFKATGQAFIPEPFDDDETLQLSNGRIHVDDQFRTSLKNVYAGGDCADRDDDLAVVAVQHGKLAALAIDEDLKAQEGQ
ncbi:NAD(P)-dependent oxidoreductase [Kistimonas scapharcae]|uniref:NAD(P)-dependent oxidoreductase n=1 Tax=Kistimonas scapharcae TaxID=1036133 RepID=A0ABP8UZB1_9GAMM